MKKLIARLGTRRNLIDIVDEDGYLYQSKQVDDKAIVAFRKAHADDLANGVEVKVGEEETHIGTRKTILDDDGNVMFRITGMVGFVEDKFVPALCNKLIDATNTDELQAVKDEVLDTLGVSEKGLADKVGQYRAGVLAGIFKMARSLHIES